MKWLIGTLLFLSVNLWAANVDTNPMIRGIDGVNIQKQFDGILVGTTSVSQIIAGPHISVSPITGRGNVTIGATSVPTWQVFVTTPLASQISEDIPVLSYFDNTYKIWNKYPDGSIIYWAGFTVLIAPANIWKLLYGDTTPDVTGTSSGSWQLVNGDITPRSDAIDSTYWRVIDGNITPFY